MDLTRRTFLRNTGLGAMALGFSTFKACTGEENGKISEKPIQGFDETYSNTDTSKPWVQTSDRKIRVGIVGYGLCKFGAVFGFQDHPNVEVVAVSDLIPERCAQLAKDCRCEKTYPSLEKMVTDDEIEAVFVATDAPSHARHCLEVMKHGKHVAIAVPAVVEDIEDADRLLDMVKKTGLKYMMFETTTFRNNTYAMREIYKAGGFGKLIYTEGEYFHYCPTPLPSYKEWRVGFPPIWYCTHSTGYYISVAGGSLTEVSCMGIPSILPDLAPKANVYKNPYGSEIGLFRTSEGGMARFAVSIDTPGGHGETGRVHGQKGSFDKEYKGLSLNLPNLKKPPLPPGVGYGEHGGSHGYLMDEFVMSIIEDRKPLVDIATALNMTVPGLVAHQSAFRDGEIMKIPQYTL
jgi:predicted dehydrogenase